MPEILVAYFSRTGRSKALAEAIAAKCQADTFAMEPVKAYSSSYVLCVAQAKLEHFSKARPELKQEPEELQKYDKIILVFPIWWFTCPNIILAFLEKHADELTGKTILPVCTFDGSGKGASEKDMAQACPKANFLPVVEVKKANLELAGTVAMLAEKQPPLADKLMEF